MGVFDGSVDLERSVLKTLLSDLAQCRLHVFRFKPEYFSSEARRFLYQAIRDEFSLTQNLVPEQVIDTVISSKHASNRTVFEGEKNIVLNSSPNGNLESASRVLHETSVGRDTLDGMRDVSALLEQGRFIEAATEFRQKAFGISLSEDSKRVVDFFADVDRRIERAVEKRDNPMLFRGLKTGFDTFDARTGGLFAGEMTLIAGVTGLGKSTILKQMAVGILRNNRGKNVLHIANEEYEDQVKSKYDALMTGRDYLDYKFANSDVMTDDVLENWRLHLKGAEKNAGGRLYIREVPAFSDVTTIRRVFYELKAQGIPIHAIMIDHMPNMKPVQRVFGENNEREKIAAEVKELARELNVAVVIPTQAATQVEEKQMKGHRASKLDVYGSKAQIHHSNTFFIITFLGKDNKTKNPDGSAIPEYLRDVFILADVKKNRDGPCFSFKLRHEVRTGRMTEMDIDPAVRRQIEREHEEALRTGDFSSTVFTAEDTEPDKEPMAQAPTPADIELAETVRQFKAPEPVDQADARQKESDIPAVEEKPKIPVDNPAGCGMLVQILGKGAQK